MRRDENGWWERTYELPRGVRCDYWFTTGLGLVADPLNPLVHVYPPNPDDPEVSPPGFCGDGFDWFPTFSDGGLSGTYRLA
jgi:hypothetical protein